MLGLLVVAPIVALSASPWAANGSLWYFGMLPAVMGLFVSPRVAFSASLLTPVLMGVALLLRDMPAAGAIYMALIGAGVGLSALRGWNVMGSFAAPLASLALIGSPNVAWAQAVMPAGSTWAAGLVLFAFTAAGGLWTSMIGQHITAVLHLKAPPVVPFHAARYFAVALAILSGIGTYVAMRWLNSPDSWWIVLTVFVIVQPYYATSVRRMIARVAGTLLGTVVAILVVAVFHDYRLAITIVALVLTLAAPWANMKRPYWVFVVFLTPAVVLMTVGGPKAIITSAGERALYTTIGAAAALLALSLGHWLITARSRRSS